MSAYRDKTVLMSFAKIAADEYMGKNAVPLNSTLKKIATQEALSPFQVEFVAAEANKAVWSKLFGMNKQASYDFPLADAKEILEDLKETHSPRQVIETDLDYFSPPITTKTATFDPMAALGIQEDNMAKSAAARKEVKRELQVRMEKLASLKEELEVQQMVVATKIQNLEADFVKSARAMILEYPFEERSKGFEKVAEFLRGCEKPELSRNLLTKLSTVLKRQGLVKEADMKAPENLISDRLPARIVNGRHSLYVTIKTLHEQHDLHNELGRKYEIVDSSLPVVKEKIREL